jgi:hypothetical protein
MCIRFGRAPVVLINLNDFGCFIDSVKEIANIRI